MFKDWLKKKIVDPFNRFTGAAKQEVNREVRQATQPVIRFANVAKQSYQTPQVQNSPMVKFAKPAIKAVTNPLVNPIIGNTANTYKALANPKKALNQGLDVSIRPIARTIAQVGNEFGGKQIDPTRPQSSSSIDRAMNKIVFGGPNSGSEFYQDKPGKFSDRANANVNIVKESTGVKVPKIAGYGLAGIGAVMDLTPGGSADDVAKSLAKTNTTKGVLRILKKANQNVDANTVKRLVKETDATKIKGILDSAKKSVSGVNNTPFNASIGKQKAIDSLKNMPDSAGKRMSMRQYGITKQELDSAKKSVGKVDVPYQGLNNGSGKAVSTGDTLDSMVSKLKNISKNNLDNNEAVNVIKKTASNPNAKVTVYRATPGNGINGGDWVFLTKAEAERFTKTPMGGNKEGFKVVSQNVTAKDVDWSGKNLEFVYNPKTLSQPTIGAKAEIAKGKKVARPAQSNKVVQTPIADGGQTKTIVSQNSLPVGKESRMVEPSPKLAKISPLEPIIPQSGKKVRGFAENIAKNEPIKTDIPKEIPGYNPISNRQTLSKAAKEINADPNRVFQDLLSKGRSLDVNDNAKAQLLLRKFIDSGDMESANQLAKITAKNATEAGQAIQILSTYSKITPEGALRDISKRVADFNVKQPNKPVALTPEISKQIVDKAKAIEKLTPESREWTVAVAELEKMKAEVMPNTALGVVNKLQTMAQLLNPKTALRNVVGNTALDIFEDASRITAAGIDKALYGLGFTKQRNMILPDLKSNWLNKMTGFKMGVDDVNRGIRTTGSQGQFDITKDVFKKGTLGNKLEKLLGYELSSFDKAFYTGRYQSSLENMIKAVGKEESWMKPQAEAEALYATFQNNSAIAKGLQTIKRGANVGKEWGVGDLILKYPKTPGNIVSVGLDYSPVGFVKGLKQFYDSVKFTDPAMQRDAILNLSRGITGTGLILGGAMLAKKGIITGESEKDADMRQLKREAGQGPFSFNFSALGRLIDGKDTKAQNGDVIANYDWLQPNAIQLSMGANMVLNKGKGIDAQMSDAWDSLGAGIDTITQQPLFSGVQKIFGDLNPQRGGSIGKAIKGVATSTPASFVPSALNQVGQLFDNTQRNTYNPNSFGEAWNKTIARLPGARGTLQPKISPSTGQPLEQYQSGSMLTNNNPINVFLNPAFVRKYNVSPEAKEVIDIYNRSGETQQTPRLVQTKIKINGQQKVLSPEEVTQYQSYIGTKTQEGYSKLISDPTFMSLNDEDKAKKMSNLLTDINRQAKIDLFGQEAKATKPKAAKLSKVKKVRKTTKKRGRKVASVKRVKINSSAFKVTKAKFSKVSRAKKMPKLKIRKV